jgi:hypothetical protein
MYMEDIRMALERNIIKWVRAYACLILAALCLLLVPNRYAFGQVDEGSITGTVLDATGAVIPNALVTLVNTDQGITQQTRTNSSGGYTFSPVRIGHYTVSASAKGFAKTTQQNLEVAIAQTLMVNIQLKLGAETETITVTSAPPMMQTEEASVGQVVSQESVNSLPLNGRNFTFLAQIGAGMQTPQADTRGNAASGAFSANGLRPAQNNYLLDGIDNNSDTVDFLNQLRRSAAVGRHPGIQGPDRRLQRGIGPFRGRGSQRHHQVRHQQPPWHGLGVLPQQQTRCRGLV